MPVEHGDDPNHLAARIPGRAAIQRMVGVETARRGLVYATRGAVISTEISTYGSSRSITGKVQGTDREPYSVVIHLDAYQTWSSCSCPMRNDCKHVAAVLIEAGKTEPRTASWQRLLSGAGHNYRNDSETDAVQVALQFEIITRKTARNPAPQLELKPVIQNPSGRWVRSGITWASLRFSQYSSHRIPREHHLLLEEILALNSSSRSYPYSYGSQEKVFLDSFPSKRIWDILAEARAAGLAFIGAGKDPEPVTLVADAVNTSLDIDASGEAWTIRPVLTASDHELAPQTSILLGKPAHGIAWWSEGGDRLSISRLDRSLDAGLGQLFETGTVVTVPKGDQSRFLRDFYPDLRQRSTVASRNDTFQAPQEVTRLGMTVRHSADHRVAVQWKWNQTIGDETQALPIWPVPSRDSGDAEAHRQMVAQVEEILRPIPGLFEHSAYGPRLADEAVLDGMETVTFVRDLLPHLRAAAEIDVTESGVAPDYQEAESAPVISLGGATQDSQGPSQPINSDWFDLDVSVSVDGETVPFEALFRALAKNQEQMILPSGRYFAIDLPELQQLRTLIAEARALSDRRTGPLRISRFQASLWEDLEALGVVSQQASQWAARVNRLRDARIRRQDR